MRTIHHAHLLQPIAAFMRGKQCGFIVPRARGSLRTFCDKNTSSMYGSEKIISWLFTQLLGITDGLQKLHDHHYVTMPSTRHGALKPDNILWFPGHKSDLDTPSLGTLIIGDAGRRKGLSNSTSRDRHAALRYVSWERPRSTFDDIWSLGLIFFEFVIWLIRGNREVQKFRSQTSRVYLSDKHDYYFEIWSSLLMNEQRCLPGTPLGELVQFIVRRLLVPRFGSLKNADNPGRATASEFYSWVCQVRSAVSASGSSYTVAQQGLPELPPPRSYKRLRQSSPVTSKRVSEPASDFPQEDTGDSSASSNELDSGHARSFSLTALPTLPRSSHPPKEDEK